MQNQQQQYQQQKQENQGSLDPFGDNNNNNNNNNNSTSFPSSRSSDSSIYGTGNETDIDTTSILTISRKQRFLNFMKTTKDVYIPQIRSTISQKASSRLKAAMEEPYLSSAASWIRQDRSQPRSQSQSQQQQQQRVLPEDMRIVFFPTYTCQVSPVEETTISYKTVLRFTVNVPANFTTRKNKLIFSVCKQALITQPPTINAKSTEAVAVEDNDALYNNDDHGSTSVDNNNNNNKNNKYLYHSKTDTSILDPGTNARSRLSNAQSETSLVSSTEIGTSEETISYNNNYRRELSTLKERLSGFLAGGVSDIPVIVELFDSAGNYHTARVKTDVQGNVFTRISTEFVPNRVKLSLDTPPDYPKTVSVEYPCTYLNPTGIGLISDIDDTVKHTGVTGDKRSLVRNVFVQSADKWIVDGMPRWYNTLHDVFSADIFYVSNSPIQLHSTFQRYISNNYPMGPIFLKQYVGNILSSVMASSATRKLQAISDILRDFPQKRFILVGDSGEKDFEAYISIATQFPDQIVGIYIRRCENSITEFEGKQDIVMSDLNKLIRREVEKLKRSSASTPKPPPSPPPVPPKRVQLTATQLDSILDSRQTKRRELPTSSQRVPPALPPRSSTTTASSFSSSSPSSSSSSRSLTPTQTQSRLSTVPTSKSTSNTITNKSHKNNDDDTDEYFDRMSDSWRARIIEGIERLNSAGVHDIGLMIFSEPEVALEDTVTRLRKLK